MRKAKVIFDKDYVIGESDKRLFGSFVEHLGRCLYGGVYEPGHKAADKNGFRNDVKVLIKELGVSAIRYPGGNFVSGYDWKDGVGPKEERPHRRELAWNTIETNEVGVNEFAEYLNELGIEMILAANLGTGSPKEAGELVDYCNTPEGTYFSELRKKHGVEKPHNFKLWCLGNEMDGEWQIAMHTAAEYSRKAKETAKIMKWMDPEIETIACGTCTNEIGHQTFGEWDRIVLEEAYEYIDYISLHRYYNYDPSKQLFYPMTDDESDIPYIFKNLQEYIDTIKSACDFVRGRKRQEKRINISFDEWGVVTNTGAIPGGGEQTYGYAEFKQLDAVIYGGLMCTFLNNADRVKIACQSLLVNEGGMITTVPGGRAIRQATFYPFRDVSKYGRGIVLKATAEFPKTATGHHGMQDTVVLSAVVNKEEKQVTIFAVNCDITEDVEVTFDLRGFGKLTGIERTELYSENPYLCNTFEDEFAIVPQELEPPVVNAGKAEVILRKHSWNVMRFWER